MKKLLLATLIAFTSLSANAGQYDGCKDAAEYAEAAMNARQQGVPLDKIIELLTKQGNWELLSAITLEAYKAPKFNTEASKQNAVAEFKNTVLVLCMRGQA